MNEWILIPQNRKQDVLCGSHHIPQVAVYWNVWFEVFIEDCAYVVRKEDARKAPSLKDDTLGAKV